MEIQGHYQNGIIIPDGGEILPDGTKVTISVRTPSPSRRLMSEQERERYLAALSRIDSIPNENPGDTFSGTDHDHALYGNGQ